MKKFFHSIRKKGLAFRFGDMACVTREVFRIAGIKILQLLLLTFGYIVLGLHSPSVAIAVFAIHWAINLDTG